MVQYSTSSFCNSRKQKLFTATWIPDEKVIKAHLIWVHGYGEYIDRWTKVFERFAEEGIAVYGHDSHGMGKSEPFIPKDRGLVWHFSDLVDDTIAFSDLTFKFIKESGSEAPVFIGGASMGGLVATHVALKRGGDIAAHPSDGTPSFSGLILQSPALDVEWTTILKIQASVGNLIATLMPRARIVPAVRPEDMNPDPKMVQEYLNDKLIIHGNLCAVTGNELLKGFRQLSLLRRHFRMPLFAVMGTSDKCTNLAALKTFVSEAASSDKELKEVPGGFHELCHGPEKEDVISSISSWILKRSVGETEAKGEEQ
mmetsp:Transcript_24351/g.43652  ORF Transcript_24351/g.43652 Transcript_24351/m.43652 type:complete len:312 (+) Transcript_24351:77-1012(+)